VTFIWTTEPGALEFILQVGSAADSIQYSYLRTASTGVAVSTLPQDGSSIYVRLYIQHADLNWTSRDYLYTAASAAVRSE